MKRIKRVVTSSPGGSKDEVQITEKINAVEMVLEIKATKSEAAGCDNQAKHRISERYALCTFCVPWRQTPTFPESCCMKTASFRSNSTSQNIPLAEWMAFIMVTIAIFYMICDIREFSPVG